MAKWLDKLKAVFVKAPVSTATKTESGKLHASLREGFTPKVGQLMRDETQINVLLQTHKVLVRYMPKDGWVVWNPEKSKYQTIRSKPMVAVKFLGSHQSVIRLYGQTLHVPTGVLQFK